MFSCLPLWSQLRVWSDYQGLTSLMCYEHHFSFPIPMVFLTVLSTLKYIQSLILNHQMPWWEKPHWILGSLTGLPLSGIWASQSLLPAFLVILSRSVVITMFTIIAGSITVYQLHFSSFVCPWHILHVYWLAPFIVMQRGLPAIMYIPPLHAIFTGLRTLVVPYETGNTYSWEWKSIM